MERINLNSNSNCGQFGVKRSVIGKLYHPVPTPAELKSAAIKRKLARLKSFARKAVLVSATMAGIMGITAFGLVSCSDQIERDQFAAAEVASIIGEKN